MITFKAHNYEAMSNNLKLNLQPSFDFSLIALVSSEPIYRLGYLLNEALKLELKESRAIQIYHPKKQQVQEFSLFRHEKYEPSVCIDLIQNKGLTGLLIEEQKPVDYWLKCELPKQEVTRFLEKIKNIKNISLAFEVNPGSLKSKDRFIFSLQDEN
jgi:hypothetical protein